MNPPLRRIAIACLVLFGLLLLNVNYIQAVQADDLRNHKGNARVLLSEYDHERGQIVVGGKAAAKSVPTEDQLKYLRVYPKGKMYAPATGYYSLFGATGVERAEDSILSGQDSRLLVHRFIDLATGGKPKGGSVVLTLNANAQRVAYQDLAGKTGAVVALNPQTGAILALASRPSYDPNRLASHESDKVKKAYKTLTHADDKPLLNRAIDQTYPPGSTFKVITSAAALSSGDYQPSTQIPAPHVLNLPQTTATLNNFAGEVCSPTGRMSLADALRMSCNTAFGDLGLRLGAKTVREQAEAFGVNDQFEIPMETAKSVFPSGLDKPQTALSAIGQYNDRMTPLQMAMVASGIGNGGVVMKPYLVQEEKAPDLSTIGQHTPHEYGRAVSPRVADELKGMMELVVNQGTGTAAQVPGVQVAGKTGTAQNAEGAQPHGWFVAFAPADNPKVAVAVVVKNGGQGGVVAAPIAKDVMEAVLRR
ncbi:MAG: peptidoglycan D,D-transpeptidase FtsI family protein [Streptosporangiaceae bacterium]